MIYGAAVRIRPADLSDASRIATIHVLSWRAAYRGLLPQPVLDGLSIEQGADRWTRTLRASDQDHRVLVAERGGKVVGWASFGPGRDAGHEHEGELQAIYIDPETFSTGVGHALITAAEDHLARSGFRVAYLWVLGGNDRAARFYERHGWIEDGGIKRDERPRMSLRELRRVKRL